jgi:hypothetical protein
MYFDRVRVRAGTEDGCSEVYLRRRVCDSDDGGCQRGGSKDPTSIEFHDCSFEFRNNDYYYALGTPTATRLASSMPDI